MKVTKLAKKNQGTDGQSGLKLEKTSDGKLKIFKKGATSGGSAPGNEPDPVEQAAPWEDTPEDVGGSNVDGTVEVVKDGEVIASESENLEVKVTEPMAKVSYSLARTINLGDYESVKIMVSISVPSEVKEEEIEGNYQFVKGWCELKLSEAIDEIQQ